jgi:predicted enzyme related to lactoylglutathione lyase
MSLSVGMVTVDCSDPERLARWWAAAVGGSVVVLGPGEFAMVTGDQGPALGFQRVDAPTPGKNRVHLDLQTSDLDADVDRLAALGATETGRHSLDGGYRWVVMADPAGNVFCVAAPHG